eukprot:Rhum_TRINITY_DN15532_c0_g1::Rhum_TRINITY_DN15532_c0_g1_i1::g.161132::m.161132
MLSSAGWSGSDDAAGAFVNTTKKNENVRRRLARPLLRCASPVSILSSTHVLRLHLLLHLEPILRSSQDLNETPLRVVLRLDHVAPLDKRRQRHEDALSAALDLQTEQGSAVVHQVELDVPPPPQKLPRPLLLRLLRVHATLDDCDVRRQERRALVLRKREQFRPRHLGRKPPPLPLQGSLLRVLTLEQQRLGVAAHVVEEVTTDATPLLPVLVQEVVVRVPLQSRVDVLPVLVARVLDVLVERHAVLVVHHPRRQVHAAAEPPHVALRNVLVLVDVAGLEVPVVQVRRRAVRVPRVDHHRHARGVELLPLQLRVLLQDAGRQVLTDHLAPVAPGALEHSSVREHARAALARAVRLHPRVLDELLLAVQLAERRGDLVLQPAHKGAEQLAALHRRLAQLARRPLERGRGRRLRRRCRGAGGRAACSEDGTDGDAGGGPLERTILTHLPRESFKDPMKYRYCSFY